jgi:protein disulfide-isomerase
MRSTLLAWALTALFVTSSVAAPPGRGASKDETDAAADEEAVKSTTFNGIEVPPIKEIEGDKFAETIKDGYW